MADDVTRTVAETAAAPRPSGNTKVSRDDWLSHAMETLVDQGVEQVKILTLSERLGVSRSSFYWYFKNRQDLLQALLQAWEKRNTGLIRDQAALPSRTITGALCNLFRIFIDPSGFNHQLDFAIREWARRSSTVNEAVRSTDQARLQIVTQLFERHGYTPAEALMRARILYYMQIGYYALELHEPVETRLSNVPGYILGFTGQDPDPQDLEDFVDFVRSQAEGQMA